MASRLDGRRSAADIVKIAPTREAKTVAVLGLWRRCTLIGAQPTVHA